ncbi:MAG: RNA polymerase sigma factor [Runella slithyformis]|nr:MAG: RNA polymerase sigma factor [Runella slithyformis]TAF30949.1 MAG: RNA polymerase sigma factor [Cytophagales bacterium]TAF96849.1 MAG: RNA polymerase sigma factor [Runella sp.]TAG39860.1 MAG: RNA polymerase sigma factor [Cytophagia bacterium]TAE95701.1 MAG: RNA polymerase sigma factor [Runella slithyformis]
MDSYIYINKHTELVERCKLGESKAQYELYKHYAKSMLNVCVRVLNHQGEAEDVLQEAFLDAFTQLHTFRGQSTFGAWLKQIVVNKAINQLRQRRLQLVSVDDFYTPDNQYEVADAEPFDEEEITLDVARVRQALFQLPEGYRVVLSLYLFEGYDHEEIGEILKISESTSRTQYMRGKKKLIEILTHTPS